MRSASVVISVRQRPGRAFARPVSGRADSDRVKIFEKVHAGLVVTDAARVEPLATEALHGVDGIRRGAARHPAIARARASYR